MPYQGDMLVPRRVPFTWQGFTFHGWRIVLQCFQRLSAGFHTDSEINQALSVLFAAQMSQKCGKVCHAVCLLIIRYSRIKGYKFSIPDLRVSEKNMAKWVHKFMNLTSYGHRIPCTILHYLCRFHPFSQVDQMAQMAASSESSHCCSRLQRSPWGNHIEHQRFVLCFQYEQRKETTRGHQWYTWFSMVFLAKNVMLTSTNGARVVLDLWGDGCCL